MRVRLAAARGPLTRASRKHLVNTRGFRRVASCALITLAATAVSVVSACAADSGRPVVTHGLSYMTGFGPKNYPVVSLLWGAIILSLLVVTIVGGLVLTGALVRHRSAPADNLASVPLERSGSGLLFIYMGAGITFVALLAFAVWNYNVLAAIAGPRPNAPVTIHVIGHQWWWEVRYEGRKGYQPFTTANEIHIPVGKPAKVALDTADVIHSFWVPALSGKMDTIPGQNNTTWLQADTAGLFHGQCGEYCGHQHAHMGLIVTAEAPDQFDAWWRHQLQGPETVRSGIAIGKAEHGEAVFMQHCAVCHTVRGTMAMGKVGPDLSHLMQRKTLGAATVPNTIGYLSGWISNPQHIKPGNFMPTLTLSAQELGSLRDFLQTLK